MPFSLESLAHFQVYQNPILPPTQHPNHRRKDHLVSQCAPCANVSDHKALQKSESPVHPTGKHRKLLGGSPSSTPPPPASHFCSASTETKPERPSSSKQQFEYLKTWCWASRTNGSGFFLFFVFFCCCFWSDWVSRYNSCRAALHGARCHLTLPFSSHQARPQRWGWGCSRTGHSGVAATVMTGVSIIMNNYSNYYWAILLVVPSVVKNIERLYYFVRIKELVNHTPRRASTKGTILSPLPTPHTPQRSGYIRKSDSLVPFWSTALEGNVFKSD